MRLKLTGVFLAFCLGATSAGAAPITGTFFQPLNQHLEWTEKNWAGLFDALSALQIKELILQWSAYDETRLIPLVQSALSHAEKRDIDVIVGLYHNSRWWDHVQKNAAQVSTHLKSHRESQALLIQELVPVVEKSKAFAGWYITEEIDDVNWNDPAKQAVLLDHLAATRKLLTKGPVAISGFSNGNIDPEALSGFWTELLKRSQIDRIYFQDGIGAKKLDLYSLPVYAEAFRKAAIATDSDLQVVVEVFEQTQEDPFQAIPAKYDRILQQIDIARRYSTRGVLAFSIPEYMTPAAGEKQGELFNRYRDSIIQQK